MTRPLLSEREGEGSCAACASRNECPQSEPDVYDAGCSSWKPEEKEADE